MYYVNVKNVGMWECATIKEAFEIAIFNFAISFEVEVISGLTGEIVMDLNRYEAPYVSSDIKYTI